jgi:uncharacterized RDD family membrane protein YckC
MEIDNRSDRSPGFFRRLAALLYDLVLLFGVLMIAVTIIVIPYDLVTGTPFPRDNALYTILLQMYLIATIGLFFVYFWVHGGQTLGMRAWHFQLVREDGSVLSKRDALARLVWATLCLAPAGAGFLWMLLDRDRLTCYDRLSRTKPAMLKE